uniref:Variant surface glycoprotein 1125.492 n=1 Tax=Trypanosoma brucei TaxID=5691 RepID=M4T1Z0_9TRYP|nr:variant surface glycoprotein 549 [Trypanosoma brucei]APD73252.1 variant surface glycoprotein 1125.492 [Trypanosoma brucei]
MQLTGERSRTLILALLLLTQSQWHADGKELGDDDLATTLNTRCLAVEYLALRDSVMSSKVLSAFATAAKNTKLAAQWEIMAAGGNDQQADAFAALAVYGRAVTDRQLAQLHPLLKSFLESSATVNRRIGGEALTAAISKATFTDPAPPGVGSYDTAADPKLLATTVTVSTGDACPIQELNKIGSGQHTLKNALSRKVLLTPDSTISSTALTPAPTLTCTGTEGATPRWDSNSNLRGCSGSNNAGQIGVKISTSKLFSAATPTLSFDSAEDADNDNCGDVKNMLKQTMPTDAAVKHAICKARQAVTVQLEDLENLALSDLKSKPELVAALQELSGGAKLENDALETAIKTYFGSDAEQFKTTFVTEVKNKHSKYRKGEQLTNAPLSEQTSGTAYTSALAHLRQERNNLMKTALKASATKNVIPECAKKKKSDCDKGASCEWKGSEEKGKCEAKGGEDGVKAENGAKNTNTTGSNSFVINKVPLLIAFLLL